MLEEKDGRGTHHVVGEVAPESEEDEQDALQDMDNVARSCCHLLVWCCKNSPLRNPKAIRYGCKSIRLALVVLLFMFYMLLPGYVHWWSFWAIGFLTGVAFFVSVCCVYPPRPKPQAPENEQSLLMQSPQEP